jgi:glycosyltransferase involved in cell wall biosynthesis
MTPHIVLDLSRLMWRAARFAPTGIDRVELAYARHLIATARDRLSFTGWWGRQGLLPPGDAIAMIAALDAMWSGATVDAAARDKVQALVGKLRRHVLIRGEAPLYRHLATLRRPTVYLLVSHYRLHRPEAIERLKRRTGARVVMLIHDLIPIEHPEQMPAWQARRHPRRMNAVARLADGVIVNSAGTGAALRRYLARRHAAVPIVVAPLGLDLAPPRGLKAEAATPPYFVYVATIEPRKNHAVLVAAWREVRAALGDAAPKLVLVGRRGFKSGTILDAIRGPAWMAGLVEEHNRLPDAEVARLVAGASAALYASVAEGFGLPVAEALALGVPVLCSDIAELREVGRDVPEYFDPRDAAAWARAIVEYARPGSAARQAQLQRLGSWQAPSWTNHFRIVQPSIDDTAPARPATVEIAASADQV